MKRVITILGWTFLVGALLSIALVIAAVATVGPVDAPMIEINGDSMTLAQLHGGHWLIAIGGVMLALLIVVLVVPVAVLVPLMIVALLLAAALIAVVGVAALAFSPLILLVGVVWLIARLVRRDGTKSAAKSSSGTGATIAG